MTEKRRHRSEGAVFLRTNGRYVGMVNLPPGPDGKRRRKTVYGISTEDVVDKMSALKRQLSDRGDLPTKDETLGQWLTYWLEDVAAPRLKPGTLSGYRMSCNQYLIPILGRHRLPQLSPQHVRTLHKTMTERGLATNTILNAHRVLSSALTDAMRWNRVPRNVASLVSVSADRSGRDGLTVEEAKRVLTIAARDNQHGSTWFVALWLGLRQGERLGLRWQHVDLDRGLIDIAWAMQRVPWKDGKPDYRRDLQHVPLERNLILVRPKTTTSTRVVPMPTWIHRVMIERASVADIERHDYTVDHDLVWCQPDGSPIAPRLDYGVWQALLASAGVGAKTLHEARNTAVTMLFDEGIDAEIVKTIVGHSNVAMSQSYRHVSVESARKALNAVGTRLELT